MVGGAVYLFITQRPSVVSGGHGNTCPGPFSTGVFVARFSPAKALSSQLLGSSLLYSVCFLFCLQTLRFAQYSFSPSSASPVLGFLSFVLFVSIVFDRLHCCSLKLALKVHSCTLSNNFRCFNQCLISYTRGKAHFCPVRSTLTSFGSLVGTKSQRK